MRKLIIIAILGLILLAWFLYPSGIEPEAWEPDPALINIPLNEDWQKTVRFIETNHPKPEDIIVADDGHLFASAESGAIVRIDKTGKQEVFVRTGGRPLGLAKHPSNLIIVADAKRGLLAIDKAGAIRVLVPSEQVPFVNDCDVDDSGLIYFSSTSSSHGVEQYEDEIIANRRLGALYVYDIRSNSTRPLIKNIAFANGVAVAKNQQFVLVAETSRYRIHRYWISGPRLGQSDLFLAGLPGFPDGISTGPEGLFWIAIGAPRNPLLDSMSGIPWLRQQVVKLPQALRMKPTLQAMLMVVNERGKPLRLLRGREDASFGLISSVEAVEDKIYLGTLIGSRIAEIPREAVGLPPVRQKH